MPKRVYSYIRFSTPQQLRGDSLRRQLAASEAWAKERGCQIDNDLRDLGRSAYHGDHAAKGALGAFLAAVRDGRVPKGSLLLVEHLDRLSREAVTEALAQFVELIRAGITVVTLQDNREFSKKSIDANPMDLMLSIMLMAQANTESKKRSERIKEKWAQWRKGGGIAGNHPGWIVKQAGKFSLDAKWAPIVRRIIQMSLDGDGINRVARILNKEGLRSFKGGGWQPLVINRLLHNHAIYGAKLFRSESGLDEEIHKGYYPALIDEPTFYRIQSLLKLRRGDKGRHSETHLNVFSGLTYCGHCENRMRIQRECGRGKDSHYLVCDNWKRGLGCEHSNRTGATWLEQQISKFIAEVGQTIIKRSRKIERDETKEIEAEIERLSQSQERLVSAIADSDEPPVGIVRRIKETEKELLGARQRLHEAKERQKAPQKIAENIEELMKCADRVKLRDVMREVFGKIEIERGEQKRCTVNAYFRDGRHGTMIYDKTGTLWEYLYEDQDGCLKFTVD